MRGRTNNAMINNSMIHMEGIHKSYKLGEQSLHVLHGVTLDVYEREFVSIIGQSGSGKSTLMNILGCLDTADEGLYTLDGEVIADMTEDELSHIRSRKIGFVFQQFHLLAKLNAIENVELPLIYQNISQSKRHKLAEAALESVGLAERMRHKPQELSGGQQQRVAIARALVTNPSLILADEPTGNLDSSTGEEIMRMLLELNREGHTIVLITHDAKVASRAQRSILIQDGRVLREGEAT